MREPGTLQVPGGLDRTGMNWVDEAIWGHRFRNDQSPWLLLIELLNICATRLTSPDAESMFPARPTGAPDAGDHESFTYSLPKRMELRHILFRDHRLDEEASHGAPNDAAQWNNWIRQAEVDSKLQFDYLRQKFPSFESFSNTARLLRSLEAEPGRNRRWSSKHLVPHGPEALMADMRERKTGEMDNDRRFFARGGELMFLMLSRSNLRDRVEPLVRERLLSSTNRWNKLAARLQPKNEVVRVGNAHVGYLPVPRHARYDALAEDWVSLLEVDGLPSDYALEPLMRLTGLHAALYLLERAVETADSGNIAPIPLEMISSGGNAVRKLSTEQFHANQHATREALKHRVRAFLESEEWRTLPLENTNRHARELLWRTFGWNGGDSNQPPDKQFEEFYDNVLKNHASRLGPIPNSYLQKVGLAVRRKGAGSWYAPSDGMLEALVLANVQEPVELRTFLERLHERYSLVVGPQEARRAFGEMPVREEQLTRNLERFEERMRALGFLHRLSDDCAFVHNPFVQASRAA